MTVRVLLSCSLLLLQLGWCRPARAGAQAKATPEQIEFFEKRVRPLLVTHCYSCHSADAKKVKSELYLDTRAGVHKGGMSGPAVVSGRPNDSLLIKAVRYQDKDLRMPPNGKLSADEIASLEAWVKMGVPDTRDDRVASAKGGINIEEGKKFWSFQPVKMYPPPAVKDNNWPLAPIDRFVLAKLEAKGLEPLGLADKRTLLRRATYDLTGLPPTPEEIDAFLRDASPNAFDRVIERLLASPAYGERWARHWLDVVRYADTAGDNSDYPIPQMYEYRNWVIDAFNRDMPYDQFVREQLAGDLLTASPSPPPLSPKGRGEKKAAPLSPWGRGVGGQGSFDDQRAKIIATGYLANSRRHGSYEDARYPWHLTIEDTIDNFGKTFLGQTLGCCRCHDHKFDPLTSEDYYALYGFFSSTRYPWPGIELDRVPRDLVPLAPPAIVERLLEARRRILGELDDGIKLLEADKVAKEKALKAITNRPSDPKQQAAIAELKKQIEQAAQAIKEARKDRDRLAKAPLPFETAYAVIDGAAEAKKRIGQVGDVRLHIKGDPERLGTTVPRRFPLVLGGQKLSPDVKGSGRLELATWLTDRDNPLTSRVMVNRIWQYHFGRGIVATPNDFGKQGRRPTHPELLDYLARRFIDSGWSLKDMHRLIMRSRVYQLSSHAELAPRQTQSDPENDYLWHYARRRLDAESIRDTILTVSGSLDRSPGGPHPFPNPTSWDFTQHKPFKAVYATPRRSVYLMTQRIQRHPFLALFDGPDTNAGTGVRSTSTTPLQALFLMNDPFMHEQARQFASRLLSERPNDAGRIERAFQLAFARPPTGEEQEQAQHYLAQVRGKLRDAGVPEQLLPARTWESLVRVLFLSNEFVYVN